MALSNALPADLDWLERYLGLTARDIVGAELLASRPAFVASAAGAPILWANLAALPLFGVRSLAALREMRLGADNPLRHQLASLARTLPADRSRRESLRFPLLQWVAECRRLNLEDGTRAVLAVAQGEPDAGSLRTRAEELAAALATDGRAVAILDEHGRALATSDGLERSGLAAILSQGSDQRFSVATDPAVVRFHAHGRPLLLAVFFPGIRPGPVESAAADPAQLAEAAEAERPPAPVAAAGPGIPAAEAMVSRERSEPVDVAPTSPFGVPHAGPLTGTEVDAFRRIREALVETDLIAAAATPVAEPQLPADPQAEPPPASPALPPALQERPPPATPLALSVAPHPGPFDEGLLDRLPIGILIFRNQRTLFVNRTLLDLLGYESEAAFTAAGGVEAVFADGTRNWVEGDFDDSRGRLVARTRGGLLLPVEARLKTVPYRGETTFLLSLRARPEANEGPPEPTALEARVRELETILDTATDGVLTLDRHGTILSMNRAAQALFAVDFGEFKGRSFTELLADESRRSALDYLDGLAANGVASVLNDGREVIGKVPHGGLIPLFMTMGRLGDSGGFSAVMRDITHWKTIEEELIAARREAEAANTQKSEFLAKISHEIRTPLNAIIGFSEIMMEQRFGPVGNDRYRAYLNDIHVSGAHLMSLINDLLDLSKIEAGKVDLTFEAASVNAIIQECVALMQPLANRERIIIRTSLSTDLPNVVADQRSLRQILLNLMSNAIKFTRAGGQVIVSTLLEDSGEVVVRIRDTGVGMSDKDIATALKPFEQIAAAQGGDKGTGLGLPLTKAMVEANRATFAIESALNQGTLVRITFPTTRVLAG